MFLYNFDPSYTTSSMLKALIKVLKIKYVYSLMREDDLSDDILNFHRSSYMTFWEQSTKQKYNSAFKVIARKIFQIISVPVYDKEGKFIGYKSGAGYIIKNRPIYTLITQKDPISNSSSISSDCNILILKRRTYYFDYIIEPQFPVGGIIKYLKVCLKNQDVTQVSEHSRFFKSKNGTLSLMDNVFIKTIPSSFDDLVKENDEIYFNITNPQFKDRHGFSQDPKLEYDLRFLIQRNITPPELLVLNEIALSEFIVKKEEENRYALDSKYSDISRLENNLFNQYIVHLLSRELNISIPEVINSFLTPNGRELFRSEEEEFEEECRMEEEYREDCARYQAEKSEWQDYEKELEDELNDIRMNGGDWIED